MNRFYTNDMLDFLREKYPTMECRDLVAAFNVQFNLNLTYTQIKSALQNHKIKAGRTGMIAGRHQMYSKEQIAWLRKEYPDNSKKALLDAFNQRFALSLTMAQLKGILSRKHVQSGRTGCFARGETPWNKGRTCPGLGANTKFTKGHVPANRRALYSERVNCYGYIEIKVPERHPHTGAPTRFRLKHSWLWEQKYGLVPAGSVVVFRDGDKTHCVLSNLELMSRIELMQMNRMIGREGMDGLHGDELNALRIIARLASIMYRRCQRCAT